MIEVKRTQIYRGPNIWARMPVILFVTDIGELEARPTNKTPGFYERAGSATTMKRVAETDEIIGPVLYLASEASSFVTGEDHIVAGGMPRG